MTRLCENLKVKRFVAWLLLLSIVMSSFIASTTESVYADSNSRRRTSINLAKTVGFGDISNFDDIDDISLQTIAIYLSNFYLPFITILDGDYSNEGAEDSGNKQHVQAMKDALIKNCGFKKDVAEYLVAYVLEQSLSSCKTMYMKAEDLEYCFKKTSVSVTVSGNTIYTSYLGLSNGQVFDSALEDGSPAEDEGRWKSSSIAYNGYRGKDDRSSPKDWRYIDAAQTVIIDGTEYVPISYAIFLGVMANLRNTTGSVRELGDYEFYALKNVSQEEASLYNISAGLHMMPVFSNSRECLLMLLYAFQYCDTGNGFSNGFASISSTDVESIGDPDLTQYSLAMCPNMYVNWEGSIILDNGVYRTVVLPGCMNPYMVQSYTNNVYVTEYVAVKDHPDAVYHEAVGGDPAYYELNHSYYYDNGSGFGFGRDANDIVEYRHSLGSGYDSSLCFINNTALSSIGLKLAKKTYPVTFRNYAYWNWRVIIGSNQTNFDQAWLPWEGWGENQALYDLLTSVEYISVEGTAGDDYARFPVLTQILSDVYRCSENHDFACYEYGAYNSDGINHTAKDIVWINSFDKVTDESTLKTWFDTSNVFDLVNELNTLNVDTYAQFRNIKKQGHSLTYPASTMKLFQNIYLTYCFAAFNSTYDTYDDNTNIVGMRLNFKNFPSANMSLDWSSIKEAVQENALANEVMSLVYYLLHPTEGVAYVARLFKNKVGGILLSWHEDIVGATNSNAATGMTKYLGTSSYTTMPSLKDISWVAGLLNIYNNIVVYLIILMCLILLCYVLTGSMTIQRGILGVVMFGICAFLPPVAINAAVDTINTASDGIFSKKFDYWAICQLQNFVDSYEDAMEANQNGNFASYAAFVISTTKADISEIDDDSEASAPSFSGVKVKWMAPKKYNSLASLVSAVNEGTAMGNSSASFLRNSLLNIVAKSTSGETYLSDTDSLYLYRDYSDIFKYAHASYNILSTFNYKDKLGTSSSAWIQDTYPLAVYITNSGDNSYIKAWTGMSADLDAYKYIKSGFGVMLEDSALSEISGVYAVSKGYLFNTLGYEPTSTNVVYKYLFEHSGDPALASRNTLAISYLANYAQTFREVHNGLNNLRAVTSGTGGVSVSVGDPTSTYYNFGLPKSAKDSSTCGSYMWGYQEIIGLKDTDLSSVDTKVREIYKNLSDVTYGLYTESPFYYFNANIRDQVNAAGTGYSYDFSALSKGKQDGTTGDTLDSIAKMFLQNNQEYFFNLTDNAGDGYGELRDFTNMHDMFYFVIPYLREGVELARLYDSIFGLYTDDDCSLIVEANGSCLYDGKSFDDLAGLEQILKDAENAGHPYTQEELYKLWHTYNTYTILSAYTPWIDTMLDCDYHKSETITVMGDKFSVSDPLNPYTYFKTDTGTIDGKLVEGRYMIFSRSEMNAMGLTTADLTTVERKIIQFQDNVYNNAINLMNYYTFSDEVLLQAYTMLQTFEFNKLFSQTSLVKDDYIMYPQGYELKAFSYDAYLRMVVSGASGESLMFNGRNNVGNVSIYERVMKNTSLFFGIFLLINDLLAVYLIPGLKVFFVVTIFICSILILIGAVIKMEMNIFSVLWKSLFAPLLSFSAICIGMSLIVSMFMHTGANGVVSSEFVISVGDPTSAIILMIILNVLVVVLMWKVCKKCFRDLITYGRAVFDNIGSTVVGAVGAVAGGFAAGRAMNRFSTSSSGGSGVSSTAKQRGKDNDPRSGRSGVGGALAAGAGGMALGAAAVGAGGVGGSDSGSGGMAAGAGYDSMTDAEKQRFHDQKNRAEDTRGMNKYDKKAYDAATAKQDAARDKAARDRELAASARDGSLRKKRYEMAEKIHQRQADSAAIKADNVKKYGTGLKSNMMGMSTIAGKGRSDRLDNINKATAKRNDERSRRAAQALEKQNAERAKPLTDVVKKQTAAVTREQRRTTRAINRANYGSKRGGNGSRRTVGQQETKPKPNVGMQNRGRSNGGQKPKAAPAPKAVPKK